MRLRLLKPLPRIRCCRNRTKNRFSGAVQNVSPTSWSSSSNMILDNIVLNYTKAIFDIFPVLQSLKYNSSLIIENKNLCMNEVQDGFLAQNQCCVLAFCVNKKRTKFSISNIYSDTFYILKWRIGKKDWYVILTIYGHSLHDYDHTRSVDFNFSQSECCLDRSTQI